MDIKVVEITKIEKHPDAKKLNICTVSDGKAETLVVCGAANAKLGMKTILAEVGTTLPSGTLIKEANLRGVDSFGMLCSAKDLAIATETGIIDLPENTKLGESYKNISQALLSSIPWHSYKKIESFYQVGEKSIKVNRKSEPLEEARLISETYFHNGEYLYRNFSD